MAVEELQERGIPPLRAGGGASGKLRIMMVAFVVLIFLVLIGLFFYSRIKEERAAAQAEVASTPGKPASENRDTDLKAPPKFIEDTQARRESDPAGDASAGGVAPAGDGDLLAPPAAGGAAGGGEAGRPAEKTPEQLAEEDKQARRQHAPVLAFSRGGPQAQGGGSGGRAKASDGDEGGASEEGDSYEKMMMAAISASTQQQQPQQQTQRSPLDQQLSSDSYAAAVATRDVNQSFMVKQGTMGRCVMRTSFNSQLAGFSSCILSDPLYSADGRFVLAESGSEVTGTYQTGQLKPGMSRAFVVWNQIRTPHGVRITLDSPATDAMGQSGISGKVNNHFWKRFGSGLLLSLVDDAATQLSGSARDYQSTSQSMNQAAAIAVENNVNIPPTIRVKSGAVVNIFVARDLDFSSVYSARLAAPAGGR